MRPSAFLVLAGLASAAGAGVWMATRWGIGTSVDSVAYLQGARALSADWLGASFVQHAPLYPILLALGGPIGLDPADAARWLNAVVLATNVVLIGVLARQVSAATSWSWIAAPTLALAVAPMVTTHLTALSEPVFLACMLGGFLVLGRDLDDPSLPRLGAAALLLGLALLARYAGAACVLTGALAIATMGRRPWPARLGHAALLAGIATLPMIAWMARNAIAGDGATPRELAFHPVGLAHAWQALYTASGWLLIPQAAPNLLRVAVWGGLLAAAAWAFAKRASLPAGIPAPARVLALFVVVYAAFLATSISFLDANTPLDDRILLPALVALLVLGVFVADTVWPLVRPRRALRVACVAVVVAFAAGHGVRAAELARASYRDGWGFTHRAWRESPLLGDVARLDPAVPVYSNAPEIVYLRTGREARGLPRKRFLMSQQDNPAFLAQLGEVARQTRETCGVVAYVRGLDQKALPGEDELGARLGLDRLVETADGVIWGVRACR